MQKISQTGDDSIFAARKVLNRTKLHIEINLQLKIRDKCVVVVVQTYIVNVGAIIRSCVHIVKSCAHIVKSCAHIVLQLRRRTTCDARIAYRPHC